MYRMDPQRIREQVRQQTSCELPNLCYGAPGLVDFDEVPEPPAAGLGSLGVSPGGAETTWTAGQKATGVGLGIAVVGGLLLLARSAGRCGKLKRWYEYAYRTGGPKDNEAALLRAEARAKGCAWVKPLDDRDEQERLWAR